MAFRISGEPERRAALVDAGITAPARWGAGGLTFRFPAVDTEAAGPPRWTSRRTGPVERTVPTAVPAQELECSSHRAGAAAQWPRSGGVTARPGLAHRTGALPRTGRHEQSAPAHCGGVRGHAGPEPPVAARGQEPHGPGGSGVLPRPPGTATPGPPPRDTIATAGHGNPEVVTTGHGRHRSPPSETAAHQRRQLQIAAARDGRRRSPGPPPGATGASVVGRSDRSLRRCVGSRTRPGPAGRPPPPARARRGSAPAPPGSSGRPPRPAPSPGRRPARRPVPSG